MTAAQVPVHVSSVTKATFSIRTTNAKTVILTHTRNASSVTLETMVKRKFAKSAPLDSDLRKANVLNAPSQPTALSAVSQNVKNAKKDTECPAINASLATVT